MTHLTLSYLSFGLALVVGILCYLLVKRTADEFDRWYEQPRVRALHFPAAGLSLLAVIGLLALLVR